MGFRLPLNGKKPGETLTVEELAEAMYEGAPHVQNLAETLARQHGQAGALCFFGMQYEEVRAFWTNIARQIIEHSKHWKENDGCCCVLDDEELARLRSLPEYSPDAPSEL